MNFGLLLPRLPQTQSNLHPDVIGARDRTTARPFTPTPQRDASRLAARWRDVRTRVFRV
ncbi:hypothetical protein [Paraburkholderia acidisoli]|uniref:Uncharacterized protein n=1 Tax=Paraburkholderia acidisoli TaxID=2571748 RepID=A0A7Z2GL43_9BURK|nr:hypothetical protein [Paraburkholderia acidisoli]QGZ63796.1 hypothetical protein FAZ98_18740 [Paraburkholderia acidisoli]